MKLIEFKEYQKNSSEEGGNIHTDHGSHEDYHNHYGKFHHGSQNVGCNQQ